MSVLENIAQFALTKAMNDPVIRKQIEDCVTHILDIHGRLVRIEEKLDLLTTGMKNGKSTGTEPGSTISNASERRLIEFNGSNGG